MVEAPNLDLFLGSLNLRCFFDYPVNVSPDFDGRFLLPSSQPIHHIKFHSHFIPPTNSLFIPNRLERFIDKSINDERFFRDPHWKGSSLLTSPDVENAILRISELEDYQLLVFYGHIYLFDFDHNDIYEYFNMPIKRRVNQYNAARAIPPLYPYLLPRFDSTFLHSAGVMLSGGSVLFVAESGGGKTTTTMLAQAQRYRVLGDDKTLIQRYGDVFTAHATPYNRVTDGPMGGRINGLVLLKKDTRFSVTRIPSGLLMEKIWRDNSLMWMPLRPDLRRKVFEFYWSLVSGAPTFEMSFAKNYIDWDYLEQSICSGAAPKIKS